MKSKVNRNPPYAFYSQSTTNISSAVNDANKNIETNRVAFANVYFESMEDFD
jgi:hypothetical protein